LRSGGNVGDADNTPIAFCLGVSQPRRIVTVRYSAPLKKLSLDDALFQRTMYNPCHVIQHLLPARRELAYNIRQRHHDR